MERKWRELRRGWLVLACLMLALLTFAASASNAASAGGCGPSAAKTVAATSKVRIFEKRLTGTERALVYGCLKPGGRPMLLGPHPERGWAANFLRPLVINGVWGGGIEHRVTGRDTGALFTAARSFKSGIVRRHCSIGGGDQPGDFPRIYRRFLAPSGSFVWAAEIRAGKRMPQIGVCEAKGPRIIAEEEGIDLNSVTLKGFTLSWTGASGRRSTSIH